VTLYSNLKSRRKKNVSNTVLLEETLHSYFQDDKMTNEQSDMYIDIDLGIRKRNLIHLLTCKFVKIAMYCIYPVLYLLSVDLVKRSIRFHNFW
jgi:hypothetical protein